MKHCVDPQVEIDNSGDSNLAIDNKSGNMCSSEITYYCDNPCYEVSPFQYSFITYSLCLLGFNLDNRICNSKISKMHLFM